MLGRLAPEVRQYLVVTGNYWAFTLTDGALRMLVVLHFHQLGYTPLQIAMLFLFYEVFGVVRRLSAPNVWRIQHLLPRITLLQADLLDQLSLIKAVEKSDPAEFYNLGAMSFVPSSWDQPMLTGEFNAQGVTRALEAVRSVNPKIRFYQASSSEMYGRVREVPQTEMTPFYPRSPYGVSKVSG